MRIPVLKLKGDATADNQNYGVNFSLMTSAGDLAAQGKVGMTSERYDANLKVREVNVAYFMPELGIGR